MVAMLLIFLSSHRSYIIVVVVKRIGKNISTRRRRSLKIAQSKTGKRAGGERYLFLASLSLSLSLLVSRRCRTRSVMVIL